MTRIGDIDREFVRGLLEDGNPELSASQEKLNPSHARQSRGKAAGYPSKLVQTQGRHKLHFPCGLSRSLAQGDRQFLGTVQYDRTHENMFRQGFLDVKRQQPRRFPPAP